MQKTISAKIYAEDKKYIETINSIIRTNKFSKFDSSNYFALSL